MIRRLKKKLLSLLVHHRCELIVVFIGNGTLQRILIIAGKVFTKKNVEVTPCRKERVVGFYIQLSGELVFP